MRRKVILAYTGGITTSLCIHYLTHYMGLEVIAYVADLGGRRDVKEISANAQRLGATQVHISDMKSYFVENVAFHALRAGAEFANGFFLARAMSSVPIILGLVNIAEENHIRLAAHGSPVASNEQVRFENLLASLSPDMEFISPPRLWPWKTRESMVEHLKTVLGDEDAFRDIRDYSLDENLWGTTFSFGPLKDSWFEPPEEMYRITREPRRAPNKGETVEVGFRSGLPVSLNGREMGPLELVEELNLIAAEHGIGREDLVSDGLTGIKLREVCEYPGAKVLFTAHRALELITLSQKVLQHQEWTSIRYGEMIMAGDWFTTLRQALDSYFDVTQTRVTGTVKMMLRKGKCTPIGRRSPHTLVPPPQLDFPDLLRPSDLEGYSRVSALLNRIEAERDRSVPPDASD